MRHVTFEAAIFDLDGTLLDSMETWADIDRQILARRGLPVPENYVLEICSRSFEEAAQYTIELFDLQEQVDDLVAEWNQLAIGAYAQDICLRPQAEAYLRALKRQGVKLAVATGLPAVLYRPCLANNGVLDLFDALCSTEEVARGKEHPDVFLLAAERLQVPVSHCLVFDDVLPAIRSAKQAGMQTCAMYDPYSAAQRQALEGIADGYLMDFSQAPLPESEA